jgi:hypothetical protein
MSAAPKWKLFEKTAVLGGLVASAVALGACYFTRDEDIQLFPFVVAFGLIFAWALVAIGVRLVFARDIGEIPLLSSRVALIWFGVLMALYSATTFLFFCLLIALPAGPPWSGVAGHALILALMLSVTTSLFGKAAINSALVFERFRRRG